MPYMGLALCLRHIYIFQFLLKIIPFSDQLCFVLDDISPILFLRLNYKREPRFPADEFPNSIFPVLFNLMLYLRGILVLALF